MATDDKKTVAVGKTDIPLSHPNRPDAIRELEEWFQKHVPNSVFSMNTLIHNRIYNAIVEIKHAIEEMKE